MAALRLQPRKQLTLADGTTLDYVDEGTGEPLVFVAGLLVNADLWRKVIAPLSASHRCIAFDLPLGAHRVPLAADADVSPHGVARMIGEALAALDLHSVTLIGVDTGGAVCQLVFAHFGERVARLVLSNCDAFEAFLPVPLRPFQWLAHVPGGMRLMQLALRARPAQRLLLALVQKTPPDAALLDSYMVPLQQPGILRDVTKFLRAINARATLEAAQRFPSIPKPVLLIWARGDVFFTDALAERLCGTFAHARLEWVAQAKSKTFVAEDAPDDFIQHLTRFLHEPATTAHQSAPARHA